MPKNLPKNEGVTAAKVPSYRLHKASGQALVTLCGKDVYLGTYGSSESKERYHEAIARWLAAGRKRVTDVPEAGLSINEILLRYVDHCEAYYKTRGGEIDERTLWHVRRSVKAVRELFGMEPVTSFGPKKLAMVRDSLVAAGFCRRSVNNYTGIIKRAFKWAAATEIVPASVWQSLAALEGLRRGRTPAPESEPIPPVSEAYVDAIQGHVSAAVWGLVQLQRYTGCRPGEAVVCRGIDIDTTGAVWSWQPLFHKGDWRGASRLVAIGPRAQDVVRQYLKPDASAFLFSPADARAEFVARRAAARKTPMRQGNRAGTNRKRNPRKKPGFHYTTQSYDRAVAAACDLAFPPPAPLCRLRGEKSVEWKKRLTSEQKQELTEWQRAHRWSPNQLRHSFGTLARKAFGLEGSQVALGHATADVTQIYAERNQELAAKVALAVG